MTVELQFTRRFSMAHRLAAGRSSLCATPHGHNEFVTVRLVAATPWKPDGASNMVAEFSDAKGRWHRFVDDHLDHALQLPAADPFAAYVQESFPAWRLVLTPGDPTTELMALLLANKCQALMNGTSAGLRVVGLELQETPTNTIAIGSDFAALAAGLGIDGVSDDAEDPWWLRNDFSTR